MFLRGQDLALNLITGLTSPMCRSRVRVGSLHPGPCPGRAWLPSIPASWFHRRGIAAGGGEAAGDVPCRPTRSPPHAISDHDSTRCAVYGRVAPQNPCPGIVNANLSPTAMLPKSAHDNSSGAIGTVFSCHQVDNGPHWGRTCTPLCDMSCATAQIVLPISIQPAPKTIL